MNHFVVHQSCGWALEHGGKDFTYAVVLSVQAGCFISSVQMI